MITADKPFVFIEGSKITYDVAVQTPYRYDPINAVFHVEVRGEDASTGDYVYSHSLILEKSAVDGETAFGSNPSDETYSQVEKQVRLYLESLTENSTVTFS